VRLGRRNNAADRGGRGGLLIDGCHGAVEELAPV